MYMLSFCSIPAGTSPEMKDLLLKLLKRNAKDRIEFGMFNFTLLPIFYNG